MCSDRFRQHVCKEPVGKITSVLICFSRRKSVFVFEVVLSTSERKGFSLSFRYKGCIKTRFSRCSSHEFDGFTVIVWIQLPLRKKQMMITANALKMRVKN